MKLQQLHKLDPVVHHLPGELLHRMASYVIIMDIVFRSYHSVYLMVGAGVVFIVMECYAITRYEVHHQFGEERSS